MLRLALSLRIAGPKCCGKSKGVELEHNSLKPGRSGAAQLEVGHSHGHALRPSAIIADYPAPTRDGRVTGPARTPSQCRDMTVWLGAGPGCSRRFRRLDLGRDSEVSNFEGTGRAKLRSGLDSEH